MKYTHRESKYLPTYLFSWFFLNSQTKASFISNSITGTSQSLGFSIIDKHIEAKEISLSNWKELKLKENIGGVYVINQINSNYVKIGITQHIDCRFNNLQSSNPNQLEICTHVEVFSYKEVEKALHFIYSENHVRGEWFELTPKQINHLVLNLENSPLEINYNQESKVKR
jgi:hypothetical protein